jgi:NADPH:quinone reductase-like Zn-dependent oxidoreductase
MRAVGIREFGGRDKLELMDVEEPKVGADRVLIRIEAAAVNPVDWKIREGRMDAAWRHVFPVVMGWDAAGVVERAGGAVTSFAPGDEVFAYCRKSFITEGTYTEYVAVSERAAALKPKSLDFFQAAAVPLAGLTAHQMLVDAADVQRDETVLVHAAAGGVGSFAVQIAAERGARVIGTASGANHDYVRSLGATEAIDYSATDVFAAVRQLAPDGVDIALDLVGDDTADRSVDVVRDGGRVVSILKPLTDPHFRQRGIKALYVFVRPRGDELAELARLADGGKLKVHLHAVLPLERAAEAHELQESGHVRGKIALGVTA